MALIEKVQSEIQANYLFNMFTMIMIFIINDKNRNLTNLPTINDSLSLFTLSHDVLIIFDSVDKFYSLNL